jgi:hypothetical protein
LSYNRDKEHLELSFPPSVWVSPEAVKDASPWIFWESGAEVVTCPSSDSKNASVSAIGLLKHKPSTPLTNIYDQIAFYPERMCSFLLHHYKNV